MVKKSKLFLFLVLLLSLGSNLMYAQRTPAQFEVGLNFSDNSGATFNNIIAFGLDPAATDGYDGLPFEDALPPFSPALEVRFILGAFESYTDIRNVPSFPHSDTDTLNLKWQLSTGTTANILTIGYNLPAGVSMILSTLLGPSPILTGQGSYDLTNANLLTQGNLYITYTNVITDVENGNYQINSFNLSQNYPNPFNPSTKIEFSLAETQFVNLKVYDVLGREVTTLLNEEITAGKHSKDFNASGLTSGIYFYSIKAGDFTETKSMILMK
jgi:hypothetical protein